VPDSFQPACLSAAVPASQIRDRPAGPEAGRSVVPLAVEGAAGRMGTRAPHRVDDDGRLEDLEEVEENAMKGRQEHQSRAGKLVDKSCVLAAFCPREVILHVHDKEITKLTEPLVMDPHECVVLWIDICKFTSLTEILTAEKMGKAVSLYFSLVIEIVTQNGGDVLKFCGDALLCSFRDAHGLACQDALDASVASACLSATQVQSLIFNVHEDDPGLMFQAKTCIALGTIHAMLVGGARDRWEYLVVGEPLQHIRVADKCCQPCKTVVTQAVADRIKQLDPTVVLLQMDKPAHNTLGASSGIPPSSIHTSLNNNNRERTGITRTPSWEMEDAPGFLGERRREQAAAAAAAGTTTATTTTTTTTTTATITAAAAATASEKLKRHLGLVPRAISTGCLATYYQDSSTKPQNASVSHNQPTTHHRHSQSFGGSIKALRQKFREDKAEPNLQEERKGSPNWLYNRKTVRSHIDSALPQWIPLGEKMKHHPRLKACHTCDPVPSSFQAEIETAGLDTEKRRHSRSSTQSEDRPSSDVCCYELQSSVLSLGVALPSAAEDLDAFIEWSQARQREAFHPLEAFVPCQVRNRLEVIHTSAAQTLTNCAPGKEDIDFVEEFFNDPSFAEMHHVTILFIKIHSITERTFNDCKTHRDHKDVSAPLAKNAPASSGNTLAFSQNQGVMLADAIHQSLIVIETNLYRYGGMLRQMTCDDKGTVAIGVFGVPGQAPSEKSNLRADDVSYAIICALEIQRGLEKHPYKISASIGVATGEAFCGILGSRQRAEYAIVGDTVNTAARIVGRAATDGLRKRAVACDKATREACEGSRLVSFSDDTETVTVKNKAKPVQLYFPQFPEALEEPFADGASLIGQEFAKTVLMDALKDTNSGTQRNQIVVFLAEHGMGKTALWRHAAQYQLNANHVLIDGNAVAPIADFYNKLFESHESTKGRSWVKCVASLLRRRNQQALTYFELLQDLFPERATELHEEHRANQNIATFSDCEAFSTPNEREAALCCLLVAIVQAMCPFQPLYLSVDNAHGFNKMTWRWLVILVATCSTRQLQTSPPYTVPESPLTIETPSPLEQSLTPLRLSFPTVSSPESEQTSPKPPTRRQQHGETQHRRRSFAHLSKDHSLAFERRKSGPLRLDTKDPAAGGEHYESSIPPAWLKDVSTSTGPPFSMPLSCRSARPKSSSPGMRAWPHYHHHDWAKPWITADSNNPNFNLHVQQYSREMMLHQNGAKSLLTVFMTALSTDSSLDAHLATLQQHHSMGRISLRLIPLRPLNEHQTKMLIESRVKEQLPRTLRASVILPQGMLEDFVQVTKGNPKAICTLVDRLLGDGDLYFASGRLEYNQEAIRFKSSNNVTRLSTSSLPNIALQEAVL